MFAWLLVDLEPRRERPFFRGPSADAQTGHVDLTAYHGGYNNDLTNVRIYRPLHASTRIYLPRPIKTKLVSSGI